MSTVLKTADQKAHQPKSAKVTSTTAAKLGVEWGNMRVEHIEGKRERQIRIKDELYQELAKLGDVTNDWNDVIYFLLKSYKDRQQGK